MQLLLGLAAVFAISDVAWLCGVQSSASVDDPDVQGSCLAENFPGCGSPETVHIVEQSTTETLPDDATPLIVNEMVETWYDSLFDTKAAVVDFNFRLARKDRANRGLCDAEVRQLVQSTDWPGTPDNDHCCETLTKAVLVNDARIKPRTSCTAIPTLKIETPDGREVLHYQTATIGVCGARKGCSGSCRAQWREITLLCAQSKNRKFERFSIPAYCSCQAN